jgi:hypothetical protein
LIPLRNRRQVPFSPCQAANPASPLSRQSAKEVGIAGAMAAETMHK